MSTRGHTPITALQLFEPDARAVYTLDAVASLTRILDASPRAPRCTGGDAHVTMRHNRTGW